MSATRGASLQGRSRHLAMTGALKKRLSTGKNKPKGLHENKGAESLAAALLPLLRLEALPFSKHCVC